MRFARGRTADAVVPVVAQGGRWFDLRPITPTIDGSTLAPPSLERIAAAVDAGDLPEVPEPTEFGPPLARIGKIVCIGLNYVDHAAETNAKPPAEPIIFMKAPDTVVGPNDEVLVPRNAQKTDYEVELAVVIGTVARYLDSPDG